MALTAYLRLKGDRTGAIKGSVTQKGREGRIAVIAVEHAVVSPRDPATGQATGKRQHEPLVITKQVDRASPLLHQVQVNNENINDFVLDFFSPSVPGSNPPQHRDEQLLDRAGERLDRELPNGHAECQGPEPDEVRALRGGRVHLPEDHLDVG